MIKSLIRRYIPRTIRNWCRSPIRSVSTIAESIRFRLGKNEHVEPYEGWQILCHPASKKHFEVFKSDDIQREELKSFLHHCTPAMRLLDIGAHHGLFALAAVGKSGDSTQVICIEASPNASDILRANIEMNSSEKNIQVVNCAIGDNDGDLEMLTTGPVGGGYFVVPTESREDTVKVKQRTIESIVTEYKFKPTHIKLDIEGFEYEVIKNSLEYLSTLKPVLFLELHGNFISARKLLPELVISWLKDIGYNRFIQEGIYLTDEMMRDSGYNLRMVCLAEG